MVGTFENCSWKLQDKARLQELLDNMQEMQMRRGGVADFAMKQQFPYAKIIILSFN